MQFAPQLGASDVAGSGEDYHISSRRRKAGPGCLSSQPWSLLRSKETLRLVRAMSALPPKADIN
jgi:hypothetical protein